MNFYQSVFLGKNVLEKIRKKVGLDLPGPLCYKTSCRFNCILYIGPNPTGCNK